MSKTDLDTPKVGFLRILEDAKKDDEDAKADWDTPPKPMKIKIYLTKSMYDLYMDNFKKEYEQGKKRKPKTPPSNLGV